MIQDIVLQEFFLYWIILMKLNLTYLLTKRLIKEILPSMSDKWLFKDHNKSFINWFNEWISNDVISFEIVKWMSQMPKFNVVPWNTYDISKFSVYTKSKDDCSTMQNSGVMVEAESTYVSSSKYKNPIMASRPYFQVIEDILEIDYVLFIVPLFKCKWINNNTGL